MVGEELEPPGLTPNAGFISTPPPPSSIQHRCVLRPGDPGRDFMLPDAGTRRAVSTLARGPARGAGDALTSTGSLPSRRKREVRIKS